MARSRRVFAFNPAIFGFFLFGAAALTALVIIHQINKHWPPVSIAEKEHEAIVASNVALERIDRPTVLVHVGAKDLSTWFPTEFEKAWSKLQNENPDLKRIVVSEPRLVLGDQIAQLNAVLTVNLDNHHIRVTANAIGVAAISLDRNGLIVRPAFQKIEVTNITGDLFWFLEPLIKPVNALLDTFQANINGALPAYTTNLPIHPLALPGEPLQVMSISIPDVHKLGSKKDISVTLPALEGESLLIADDGISVLASLTTDALPAPSIEPAPANISFIQFAEKFRAVAMRSNFSIPSATATEIDHIFFDRYLTTYIRPVDADNAVTEAIRLGEESLSHMRSPNAAVALSATFLEKMIVDQLQKRLPIWSQYQPVTFETPTANVGGQRIEVTQPFQATFTNLGLSVEGQVKVLAAGAGGDGGAVFRPMIEDLILTKLDYSDVGDLSGVLIGANTILASAAQAINAAIPPQRVDVPPITVRPIQLGNVSPKLRIQPNQIDPPTVTWGETALLIDESGVFILAEWRTPGISLDNSVPVPVGGSQEADFATYRNDFFSTWGTHYPRELGPNVVAAAYVESKFVAEYLNGVIPSSGLSLDYSSPFMDSGSTDISIKLNHLPEARCGTLSCNQPCKWYNPVACAAKAACEAANVGIDVVCKRAVSGIEAIINAGISLVDLIQASLNTSARGQYAATGDNMKITFADNLSSASLSGNIAGRANVALRLDIVPRKLANLACVDVPIDRPFSLSVDRHPVAMRAGVITHEEPAPEGGMQLVFDISMPSVDLEAHTPPLEAPIILLPTIVAQASITCPLYGVPAAALLSLVAGSGAIEVGLADAALHKDSTFGQITRALVFGQLSHTFDIPPLHYALAPRALTISDMKFVASPKMFDTYIAATFSSPAQVAVLQ